MGEEAGSMSSIKAGPFEHTSSRKISAVFTSNWIDQHLRNILLGLQIVFKTPHLCYSRDEQCDHSSCNNTLFVVLTWLGLFVTGSHIAQAGLELSMWPKLTWYLHCAASTTSGIMTGLHQHSHLPILFNKLCFEVVTAKKSQEEESLKTNSARFFSGFSLLFWMSSFAASASRETFILLANWSSYKAFCNKLDFQQIECSLVLNN